MNDVFISYSRRNKAFTQKLYEALTTANRTVWADWDSIPAASDWFSEIKQGIEECNAVIFVLSPEWILSRECRKELEYAAQMGKRLFPILHLPVDPNDVPPELAKINWVYMRESDDFDKGFQTLCSAMDTDLEWIKAHTRLQIRAVEWERKNRSASFALRGEDLTEGERLIAGGATKNPVPTPLQSDYILASRKDATRRQRQTLAGVTGALVVSIILGFLAVLQWREANRQAQIAFARQLAADANAILASPNGSAETAALLSVRALQVQEDEYVPSADEALNQSLNRLYTKRIFNQHASEVNAVAFSPNSDQILIGYSDGTALLYNANTDEILLSFGEIYGYSDADNPRAMMGVQAVAFSKQGDTLLLAGSDGYVQVWNIGSKTMREIYAVSYSEEGRLDLLWSAEFSPDGKYILLGKGWPHVGPGRTEIWDIETGQQLFSFPQNQERFISDAEFSQDGNSVLSTSFDGTAVLWDLDWATHTATSRQQIKAGSPIRDGALSSDGTMVLLGLDTSIARLFRSDGSLIRNYVGHTGRITTVTFSPDENYMLTTSLDNTARLWSIEGGNTVRIFADHTNDISEAAYAPDGLSILTGSFDNTARIWNANLQHESRIIYGHDDRILNVSFSPDGRFILSSSNDDTIHMWDAKTLAPVHLDIPEELLDPIFVFSAQGRWLVATGGTWTDDGGTSTVLTWENTGEGYKLDQVIKQDLAMQVLAFSHPSDASESKYLYLGRGNPDRYLLQAGGGWDTIARTYNNWWWNNDVALTQTASDKAEYVAVAGIMVIPIYRIDDPNTETPEAQCSIPWDGAYGSYGSQSIEFSEGGQYLVSEYLNYIIVWEWQPDGSGNEPQACRMVKQLTGHSGKVLNLTFSRDGKYLLSTSADGTAILWDITTWDKVRVLGGHEGEVTSAAFSPDGKFIVTGGADKTIRIWDTDYRSTIEQVCRFLGQIGRDFMDEERAKHGISDNDQTCGK